MTKNGETVKDAVHMVLLVQQTDSSLTEENAEAGLDAMAEALEMLMDEGAEKLPVVILTPDTPQAKELLKDEISREDSPLMQFLNGFDISVYPDIDTVLQ